MPQPKYDPKLDTTPKAPQNINLFELKNILGKAIKHPELRRDLLADPEATLRKMNYIPHDGAVDFLKSLNAASFDAAAKAFSPHHPKPDEGMAEGCG